MPALERIAVITGSSSGIGLELAKLAHADGYALVLAADRTRRFLGDEDG